MNTDKEFVQGITFKAPRDGAPDFVKANAWIRIDETIAWLQSKKAAGEESVNIQIKEGQTGKWYGDVDTWKPNTNGTPRANAPQPQRREPAKAGGFDDDFGDENIPFISSRGVF